MGNKLREPEPVCGAASPKLELRLEVFENLRSKCEGTPHLGIFLLSALFVILCV
jgi:hypothetical protein